MGAMRDLFRIECACVRCGLQGYLHLVMPFHSSDCAMNRVCLSVLLHFCTDVCVAPVNNACCSQLPSVQSMHRLCVSRFITAGASPKQVACRLPLMRGTVSAARCPGCEKALPISVALSEALSCNAITISVLVGRPCLASRLLSLHVLSACKTCCR